MRALKPGLTAALAGIITVLMAACGGGGDGGSGNNGGTTNAPPTASAGSAQSVSSGATVTLAGSGSDSDGTIASYAWTQTAGTAVTLSSNATAQPTFSAPTVASATTLTFSLVVTDNRGTASTASTVNVTVNPAVGTVNVTGRVTFDRVPFSSGPLRPLNYAAPVARPARGVVIQAVDAVTPSNVLASGITDDNGNFSLAVASNLNISLRVEARMLKTGAAPTWDIRVQDGTAGNNPYSFVQGPFNSSAGSNRNIAIPTGIDASGAATGTRASGPFAILDSIYPAQQMILGVAPSAVFPPLIVAWGPQSTSTFFTVRNGVQHIELLDRLNSDTDEFDQHVIAHEFGHYIEHNFSRADNIGGTHRVGERLDMRVAFGEGFGYAFAAMALNDPDARDSYVNNGTLGSAGFNIESNTTPGGVSGCWCSESSIWSILYDLFDSGVEAGDNVALGFGPIWSVLTGEQRITPAYTTIFSFITALKTARPADEAAINALLVAQNINAAQINTFGTNENNPGAPVPLNATFPLYTTVTPGAGATVIRSSNDAVSGTAQGDGNKLGNRRFLRFDIASTRSVTLTLDSSNPNASKDPDFRVTRNGQLVSLGIDGPGQIPETETFQATPGTYLVEVYDCATGCTPTEPADGAGSGDYDLTLTIN